MAKLICKNGDVVNISAETEAELRAAFGKKEVFYKVGDRFVGEGGEWMLVHVDIEQGTCKVSLVCVAGESLGGLWNYAKAVTNIRKITVDEFKEINGRGEFEKI